MAETHDLSRLDPHAFEHLVNRLALNVLGAGHTSFGPGSDAGRDGYFEGTAPYPSAAEPWTGTWYIQSKFHAPHLSRDPQKWLLDQIKRELAAFKDRGSNRKWPDIWILATNIDPSGAPETGAFDQARTLVKKARPKLDKRFHIWGGKKILDLLDEHGRVADSFAHLLTPGHVIAELLAQLRGSQASAEKILNYLIPRQFVEQQYTKLEQAGSAGDVRPGIHQLFIDLPIYSRDHEIRMLAMRELVKAAANVLRFSHLALDAQNWTKWLRDPCRARVWFLRGGPGRGKSTIGQFYSQIQRAAFLQSEGNLFNLRPEHRFLAEEVKSAASALGFWPSVPRIPLQLELKEYASWFGGRSDDAGRGILSFLASKLTAEIEQPVSVAQIESLLQKRRWFVSFDGLDEVPDDVKDRVANQVIKFLTDVASECDCDLLGLCTSRPQGYAGQFERLDGPVLDLIDLNTEQALSCATPLLVLNRAAPEAKASLQILRDAVKSPAVSQLMTTPLQAHIMAIVVRDGGKPPERRWNLFTRFYDVIRKREANKNFPDKDLAKLLLEEDQLLKTIHNRLGFVLHSRAEKSVGAEAFLKRDEFEELVRGAVKQLRETNIEETVRLLMYATTDRLVLVNTPEQGDQMKFDIRQLQEFFAAEFLYESGDAGALAERLSLIGGDAHWHEVVQFALSGLVELGRRAEAMIGASALAQLNRGEGTSDTLVSQRACRGAVFVARMLQEGVLEQDKRYRHLFSDALQPICASTEVPLLYALAHANQPNTRAWLVEFLLERLSSSAESESIGASIALALMLTDDDTEALPRCSAYLLAASEAYSSLVIRQRFNSELTQWAPEGRVGPPRQRWLVELVLRFLVRADCGHRSAQAQHALVEFATRDLRVAGAIAERIGISRKALISLRHAWSYVQPREGGSGVEAGLVQVSYADRDWTMLKNGGVQIPGVDLESLKPHSGLPGLLYSVLAFAKQPSRLGLANAARKIKFEVSDFDRIQHSRAMALFPIASDRPLDDQLERLINLDDKEYALLIERGEVNGVRLARPGAVDYQVVVDSEVVDWKELSMRRPGVAVYMQLAEAGFTDPIRLRPTPRANAVPDAEALISTFERNPHLALTWLRVWGALLSVGDEEVQESRLRDILISASKARIRKRYWWSARPHYQRPQRVFPFAMRLPGEAVLLPHIVHVLVEATYERGAPDTGSQQAANLELLRKRVGAYLPDIDGVVRVISDSGQAADVRASGSVFEYLHPQGPVDIVRLLSRLDQIGYSNMSPQIICAIARVTSLAAKPWEPSAVALFGNLLSVVRDQLVFRSFVVACLAPWREASQAPVTNAGLEAKWLNA